MKNQDITKALTNVNPLGFTVALKGETRRFVVALTHNPTNITREKLTEQAQANEVLDNVNIGGWTDTETGENYVDISTSVDDIESACVLGRVYKQLAVWDTQENREIRL